MGLYLKWGNSRFYTPLTGEDLEASIKWMQFMGHCVYSKGAGAGEKVKNQCFRFKWDFIVTKWGVWDKLLKELKHPEIRELDFCVLLSVSQTMTFTSTPWICDFPAQRFAANVSPEDRVLWAISSKVHNSARAGAPGR